MARESVPPTRSTNSHLVTVYKQDGRYFVGQRILHPEFGLGMVTQVRRNLIHVALDDDQSQPGGKRARRFRSAVLTLSERMLANNFSHDDLETLFEMDREDFDEHFRLHSHEVDMEDPGDVA